MNYFRLHIGDYLRDASHLSLLEHGVYTRLLQVYYVREAGISDAERYRVVGARGQDEREAVDAVLSEFFVLNDGCWRQSRCDREIADYQVKAERNREVGRLGGRPGKGANPDETQMVSKQNPDVTLASSQKPIAIREEKEIESALPAKPTRSPDGSPPAARGSRIPEGFPDAPALAWCRAERPDLQAEAVREKFRDYWAGVPGQRGRKADWPATWRNFVRSERAPQQARASPAASRVSAFMQSLRPQPADREVIDVESDYRPTTRLLGA
jgi:uncharacterized protein YdaU (DUF1376 family)